MRHVTFFKKGSNPASFCLFSFFSNDKYSINLTINDKSIDGGLGIWTQGGRMVGADESTQLWRHPDMLPFKCVMALIKFKILICFYSELSRSLAEHLLEWFNLYSNLPWMGHFLKSFFRFNFISKQTESFKIEIQGPEFCLILVFTFSLFFAFHGFNFFSPSLDEAVQKVFYRRLNYGLNLIKLTATTTGPK